MMVSYLITLPTVCCFMVFHSWLRPADQLVMAMHMLDQLSCKHSCLVAVDNLQCNIASVGCRMSHMICSHEV